MEPGSLAEPLPFLRHRCGTDVPQLIRPRPPVGPVDLRQGAPDRPVVQGTALGYAEPFQSGPAAGWQRDLVDDLQGGPLRRPDRVPVDETVAGVPGAQRGSQVLDVLALTGRQERVLGYVLDPQVQRADEPPAHRLVWGRADRWHRLGRV